MEEAEPKKNKQYHKWGHTLLFSADPQTEISGLPEVYLSKGSTLNLTCIIRNGPAHQPFIIWTHNSKVRAVVNVSPISPKLFLSYPHREDTLVKKASGFTRICTRVQTSEIAKFLDVFEDQKIAKMDIIFCHDPQVVKCRKWFLLFTYIDFKYKNEHIHRLWNNEN